jgi:hypothetical protein
MSRRLLDILNHRKAKKVLGKPKVIVQAISLKSDAMSGWICLNPATANAHSSRIKNVLKNYETQVL